MKLCLCLCVVLTAALSTSAKNNVGKLILTSVSRELDLTTTLVQQTVTMVIENQDTKAVTEFLFTVDQSMASKTSYVAAKLEETDIDLKISPSRANVYTVHMPSLAPKSSARVIVEAVFVNSLIPHPESITQNEKQLLQFIGNAYLYSPYPSNTQSTTIKVASEKIESFTKVTPTTSSEGLITYGPYSDVGAESTSKIVVHFENSGPFLAVANLLRVIEVSHWGNIAVEEHIHIKHIGANLRGSFSRYDFQRNPNSGPSAVKSYTSLLPAAAKDVYYRDEIGNISTSNLREEEDFVSLELRPRFPLFGGWQTRYYMGYNLPSYENLYHSGSQYLLKMRFVDHVFNDQFVESLTVKIILPEGARDIDLAVPYTVKEQPRELHYTYLDTVGRPVVIATSTNLVEYHIQDFGLTYNFDRVMLLQEPLLVVCALYLFFLLVIVVVRLDFSITKDAAMLARQQASVIMEAILLAHARRDALLASYETAITTLKTSEDTKSFKKSKKELDTEFTSNTEKIASQVKDLQAADPEAGSKVAELQKKVGALKVAIDNGCDLAEQLVAKKIGSQKYLDQDKSAQARITQLNGEINAIVQGLD